MSSETSALKLTKRFMKGLEDRGYTYDEIKYWKYCGGNKGSHLNYYMLCFNGLPTPKKEEYCVCNHLIEENCYITDKDKKKILVIGNCCIKKFIYKCSRTCEICGETHKNRKINRCNDCKNGFCTNCGKSIELRYKKCYSCFIKK